jgi:hypothetical protein
MSDGSTFENLTEPTGRFARVGFIHRVDSVIVADRKEGGNEMALPAGVLLSRRDKSVMMMDELFNVYELKTGRRTFALQGVLRLAKEAGDQRLLAHVSTALSHEERLAQMESDWLKQKTVNEGVRTPAAALDVHVDRTLGGIGGSLDRVAADFSGQELGKLATQVRDRVLPGGAGAITSLAYEDELSQGRVALQRLKEVSPSDLARLGLVPYVARLEELLPQFEAALRETAQRTVTWDGLRAARSKGQQALLSTIAMIVGKFPLYTEQDVAERNRWLAPILEQNERVRQARASRRPPSDIDPKTGQDLPATD